jgi:hypothetical protein
MLFGNDEHIVLAGKTGSGKSFFAEDLLEQFYKGGWRIIIIDINDYWAKSFAEPHEKTTVKRPYKIEEDLYPDRQVGLYVPHLPGWEDPILEEIYQKALEWGHTIVYHDEIIGIANERNAPQGLLRIFSQGRKFHTIGIVATQRPVGIPKMLLSQSNHVISFILVDPDDGEVMAKRMGQEIMKEKGNGLKKRFQFWHYHEPTMQEAELHDKIVRKSDVRKRKRSPTRRYTGRRGPVHQTGSRYESERRENWKRVSSYA